MTNDGVGHGKPKSQLFYVNVEGTANRFADRIDQCCLEFQVTGIQRYFCRQRLTVGIGIDCVLLTVDRENCRLNGKGHG